MNLLAAGLGGYVLLIWMKTFPRVAPVLASPFMSSGIWFALSAILFLSLYLAQRAGERAFFEQLHPLPLAYLMHWDNRWLSQSSFIPRKTFFVREGRVVGDKTRVERENRRVGPGLVINDGVSAAVFRDQQKGGLFIAGPGVHQLRGDHRLVATLSLRPLVVAVGGNPWSRGSDAGSTQDTRVDLGGAQVAARLVGVFSLLSPEDFPEPAWYHWLQERAEALEQEPPTFTAQQAEVQRRAFERGKFRTAFAGHAWSARDFASAVLTEVLEREARREHPQVPELLSGYAGVFQRLLRDAWQEEVQAVREAARMFQPLHPLTEQRWIDEVRRAVKERFTRPTYIPAGGSAKHARPSREYWQLRAIGIRARTAVVVQVYFPPELERERALAVYEPLWTVLARLRVQTQHYTHLNEERQALSAVAATLAAYMAERYAGLLEQPPRVLLESGRTEDFFRLLLALTEGTQRWLREDGRLRDTDPRWERIRRLSKWLRLWLRHREGAP